MVKKKNYIGGRHINYSLVMTRPELPYNNKIER